MSQTILQNLFFFTQAIPNPEKVNPLIAQSLPQAFKISPAYRGKSYVGLSVKSP